ncbi:MAG: alpha-hydroxy-acid oxidizing protein [Alphaproteobacteria bacterium]|nr:alpha-hydroxy-acid oxidizing protein [Alphaproteobacteria bacterium]
MAEIGQDYLVLHEFIKRARQNLDRNAWDYLVGGAESETTLRRNRAALDAIALRPRVLRDVSRMELGGRLFGRELRLPLLLAPIGALEMFEPGGGATAARAAAAFGVASMLSSVCLPGLEEVAAAASGTMLFQLYVRGGPGFVDEHVRRAVDAGYTAFCITVDSALYSRRERDLAKRYVTPGRRRATGFEFQAALNWDDVKRFKDRHAIPLVLKGIATAEDAELALRHGVEGIYVSNHGGRQLDHGLGAIETLAEVAPAVAGRATLIVDGGFLRGTDIVKAMALGADIVGLGRLYAFALAAAGEAGVVRLLELLEAEIRLCLGLLGVTSYAQLDRSFLRFGAIPVAAPRVASAFPLLAWQDDTY